MKTNRLILGLAIGLILIAGAFVTLRFCRAPQISIQHAEINVTNAPANTLADEEVGFFKTVVDQESGQYAIVNSNKTTVTLRENNGKIIWSNNIMERISEKLTPYGKKLLGNEITYMKLINGELHIFVRRSDYVVDKKTGKAAEVASD